MSVTFNFILILTITIFNLITQGSLSGGSSATHQFLGLFQARAAYMHNYFIHPVETSTHKGSHMPK